MRALAAASASLPAARVNPRFSATTFRADQKGPPDVFSGSPANKREHSPRPFSFSPERKKPLRPAKSALAGLPDFSGSRLHRLEFIDPRQIERHPRCSFRLRRKSPRLESSRDVHADLVATRPDRGTDRHTQVRRPAAPGDHLPNGRAQNILRRTPPSRVNAGHGSADGIGQKHRHAIGRADSDRDPRLRGNDGVALADLVALPATGIEHPRGVDLPDRGQFLRRKRPFQSEAVFQPIEFQNGSGNPGSSCARHRFGRLQF